MLHINPSSSLPIWSQIEEGVRHLVARGVLEPGTTVPSVRELARELRVNPATVSKGYRRLTESGVLEVRRGEGTFVATTPPVIPESERRGRLAGAAQSYAGVAITLGAEPSEAIDHLQSAYSSIREGAK